MTALATDPNRVLIVGDLHGNLRAASQVVDYAIDQDADVIVQVGDFGHWPRTPAGELFLNRLDDLLEAAGIELWFVDGNHEDHYSLANLERDSRGLGIVTGTIFHVPRGHRWVWHDKTWLGVGGAVSVDKKWRTPGWDWFSSETCNMADFERICTDGHADVVIAHDAPPNPTLAAFLKTSEHLWPADALVEALQHQEAIGEVAASTTPDLWLHGHYHWRYTDTSLGALRVAGLACDTDSLHQVVLLLDARTLAVISEALKPARVAPAGTAHH